MYLFVFNYEDSTFDVYREVPEDIDDLEEYVTIFLGYKISNVEYFTLGEDDLIRYFTIRNNDKIVDNGYDEIGQVF